MRIEKGDVDDEELEDEEEAEKGQVSWAYTGAALA
jgi:hypothetical protein